VPSFDVVSEVDLHQLTNAVDQAARIVTNRFDFKGVDAGFEQDGHTIHVHAEADFHIQQMVDMLRSALVKCQVDPMAMDVGEPRPSGKRVLLDVGIKQGLDKELAKKIAKQIKDTKLKVQAVIQGDQVRVTGKKRDELQQIIALLKADDFGQPLQFINFRD
jgi:uncharacterized protein YajQ (UPF0234 family)